jgi:hypothetical protein
MMFKTCGDVVQRGYSGWSLSVTTDGPDFHP